LSGVFIPPLPAILPAKSYVCKSQPRELPTGQPRELPTGGDKPRRRVRHDLIRCPFVYAACSYLEADMDDVTIPDDVVTSFEPQFSRLPDLCVRTKLGKILVADDLGTNEPPCNVAVNTVGGF